MKICDYTIIHSQSTNASKVTKYPQGVLSKVKIEKFLDDRAYTISKFIRIQNGKKRMIHYLLE